jgi:hypothetical protein
MSMTKRETTWYTAFKAMGSLLDGWKENAEWLDRRLPTRIFYEAVGNTTTPYVSKKALNSKPSNCTWDHFAMPQWIGRMIMDEGDIYLQDFEKFKEIASFASQTIKVTKEENKRLSLQTSEIAKIDGVNIFIETSIKDKYAQAGILLWTDSDGYIEGFPLDIPQEILDYEKQFVKE